MFGNIYVDDFYIPPFSYRSYVMIYIQLLNGFILLPRSWPLKIEKRNLPFELALLPLVESGYQPFAHSPSKASGICQFIPPTAREYKLSKSWWYDGRRDIVHSTKAASRFLRDMHRHFKNDWLLAIASYNTGAGNVGKSIRRANFTFGNVNYWELNLPKETEIYVPKLLALRDIIASSDRYGIRLAKLPNKPTTLSLIHI